MARIPDSELQHLKAAVPLVEVVRAQGRQVFKRGKDWVVLCPFHQEKTPSCVLSPEKNLYHCFGCNAGGSVLDWVMQTERLSLRKAVERLRGELGENPSVQPLVGQDEPAVFTEDEPGRQALLSRVVEFYHHTLLNAPEAIVYLEKRRLNHPELVAQFRLGFANRTLAYRLPPKAVQAGAKIRARLRGIGMMRESGHEHFTGSLIVPVITPDGQIREVYGRKITEGLRKGTPLHLYLPGPHGGVWNEPALVAGKTIILCESLIDAMSFWVAGYRNVTAAYGVNGFTDEMRQAFIRHGVKQVLIAYDNDPAGNDAAVRLASLLAAEGTVCFRLVFPAGMDANGYLCQVAEPEREFGLLIDGAVPMSDAAGTDVADTLPERAAATLPVSSLAAGVEAVRSAQASGAGVVLEALPGGELEIALSGQQWRIRGMAQVKPGAAALKVNAQVLDTASGVVFADSVDMMSARSRAGYARLAASELGLGENDIKRSLGRVLLALENHLNQPEADSETVPELDEDAKAEALALLRDPNLTGRITDDLAACGVVGESTNLLAGYLAAVSRKLDRPLAVLIQSSSAAGKSSLMDAVLNLIPPEERLQYSAMTGQSLFYLGETNLQHKILAIAEEEGVRQAAYALKLLQSDGELTIASTGKDDATGNLVTKQYTVKGPVMLMLTTTAIDVDEELLNRCLVLTVNESREQTEAIHALQRHKQTLEGLLMENEKGYLAELHQNAQRLLRPLKVVNPFASQLTFLSDKTRTRRDHMKYLTLIQSIALLHQYQREVKQVEHRGQVIEYIEVERSDIVLANNLAHEILGRTLDEMPPQTRKLLMLIQGWVADSGQPKAEYHFTRKQLRDAVQWGDTQLKIHLARLVELEYLLLHKRGLTFCYELLFDGDAQADNTHLCGLIDVPEAVEITGEDNYDSARSGVNETRSASGRGSVGSRSDKVKPIKASAGKGSVPSGRVNGKSPVPAAHDKPVVP
ncbi:MULTISPECIES: CHC2 zinc finger domain-containing protein [Lonsdalea]|uniref:DNA primase n=5 Tax=Lonsdalea TaxID=1082702 RepID=A0ACD1J7Y1_9GAMM|nr:MULTISPECIES: CHC2 zinc finger domain-containing protein [Lonsdalea]OSM94034.1 DNA primase [Lonsdalea populi]QPQ23886.1 toprim domain-containing protein [Lonsdalea populi]RAT10089.1 DNA primase [Lonsdalea quercina]RAT16568.1 DNA primase [Lonsdalea populi]RAT19882.1 DNA primase [Lonsdalea populi]